MSRYELDISSEPPSKGVLSTSLRLLVGYRVRDGEAANLNESVCGRGPDAKRFNARASRQAMSNGYSTLGPGRSVVEFDDEAIVSSLPAEDVVADWEGNVSDGHGSLNQKVMRIFSVSRVACSDQNNPCDDLATR